ncbi:acyltransferase family protein [Rufibacter latericius]|uniref:Acyltransferase n=1 Tax=Rufibacter latericius TaxID=2487040 RepID=A0A3M9N1E2_9BACT|nr:acyltransferase [Rufibacter latericius]RNI31602.1 acyltransferase [Rufibacter latericius]
MNLPASSRQYFPALTGLRAVAAFLVFAHHAKPQVPFASDFFQAFFQEAHMGVSVFFVLSGFLIALRYSQSFQEREQGAWRVYLLHRVARIYPVYLFCTVIALLFRHDVRVSSWIINLLMLEGLFPEFAFSGIGVGWSMTVELFFYAAAPLVLMYWEKLGLIRWTLITLLAGVIFLMIGQLPLPFEFFPDWNFLTRSTFFGRCFEFYAGIWLAKRFFLASSAPLTTRKVPLGMVTYGGVVGILACMFCMGYVRGFPPTPLSFARLLTFHGVNNYVLPLFIGATIWGLAREKTWLSQVLSTRISQDLGKGSYLFYLVHYTFGFDILYFHVWPNRGGVLLLLAVLSIAGYYGLEAPLRKMALKRRSLPLLRETKIT